MKYGIMGGFIKFAFAKTAFDYIEKEIPGMDMVSYKKLEYISKQVFYPLSGI